MQTHIDTSLQHTHARTRAITHTHAHAHLYFNSHRYIEFRKLIDTYFCACVSFHRIIVDFWLLLSLKLNKKKTMYTNLLKMLRRWRLIMFFFYFTFLCNINDANVLVLFSNGYCCCCYCYCYFYCIGSFELCKLFNKEASFYFISNSPISSFFLALSFGFFCYFFFFISHLLLFTFMCHKLHFQ